jgi:hypothetical protein
MNARFLVLTVVTGMWYCIMWYTFTSVAQKYTNLKVQYKECITFFFFLGPVCLSSGSTSAFKAYCAYPKLSSAQIQYPCVSYKETEVPEWGCAYIFWFNKQFPKKVVALSSQCLTAASDMLHRFILHPADSAGWISTEQAHSLQISSHWSMSSENCNCHF